MKINQKAFWEKVLEEFQNHYGNRPGAYCVICHGSKTFEDRWYGESRERIKSHARTFLESKQISDDVIGCNVLFYDRPQDYNSKQIRFEFIEYMIQQCQPEINKVKCLQ